MDHQQSNTERHQTQGVVLPSIEELTQRIDHQQTSPSQHSASFDPTRDSGNWSMQSQQSKHSSTVSSNANLHLHTILNGPTDESPGRFSAGSAGTPSSARFPSGSHNTALPTLNQPLDPREQSRQSIDASNTSFLNLDSRRSSIDSRMNVNMGHLAINNNPTSPYESTNASQQSLVSNLQQQRGIHTPIQPRANGVPGLSPLSGRPSVPDMRPRTAGANPATPRRAPAIANPNQFRERGMPDPMASEPTQGFPWAFPDKPDKKDLEPSASPQSSRHGSIAASSINTTDSTFQRSRGFSDADIHHHALQHKSITNLQVSDAQISSGNYSRTPELRVSHKLAERKRRSEMKDLFDSLNKILPNSPGNKSSKWEVLSKAIEYIDGLKLAYGTSQKSVERLREEVNRAQAAVEENHVLNNEITAMYQQLLRVDPNGHHVFGPRTQYLDAQESTAPHRLAPMQPAQTPSQQSQAPQQQNQQQQQQQPQQQQQQPPNSWMQQQQQQQQQPMQGVEYR